MRYLALMVCVSGMLLACRSVHAQAAGAPATTVPARPVPARPAAARGTPAPAAAAVRAVDLRSPNPEVREKALAAVVAQLDADPRGSVTGIQRGRYLDMALLAGEFQAVADIALRCINGQPDRMDRVEYFIQLRIKALLGLKQYPEALAAAKGYYNVAAINTMGNAIDVLAQCLDAAFPNDPAKAKRFKLQQLAGAQSVGQDPALGTSILSEILVDPTIYTDVGLKLMRGDWKKIAQGNLLLLQDKPADAIPVLDTLRTSTNAEVAAAGNESLARADKAVAGIIGPGNDTIRAFAAAPKAATTAPAK